ncbi:protein FAR1-related sequence 6, partial [Tanacetum coccineum]
KEIPSRYILSRWRKDIKHRHYYVTNCYDDFKSGEQVKKFDQLSGNFYEAAHIAKSQEKYEYLMECINMVKEQLTDESNWGVHYVTKSTRNLLSPVKVRSKGRPTVNRKIPIEEKISKKNQQKKRKKNEHGAKEIHIKEKIIKKKQQRKKKNYESEMKELQDQRDSCLSNMTFNKVNSSSVDMKTTSINGTISFDGNSPMGNCSFDLNH